MVSVTSRYPKLRTKLLSAVLDSRASTVAALRRAAYRGDEMAEPLNGYLQTLRQHAYRLQDEDTGQLRRAGYSEDQIFELTVAAALGAGDLRLRTGLAALNEALR